MNRATATCIAGMRSKTTSTTRTHFPRRCDRVRRSLLRGFGVVWHRRQETAVKTRAQPAVIRVVRAQRIRHDLSYL